VIAKYVDTEVKVSFYLLLLLGSLYIVLRLFFVWTRDVKDSVHSQRGWSNSGKVYPKRIVS